MRDLRQPPSGFFVGLATLDVIHRVRRLPAVNEKITAAQQFVAAGGPATNAAVAFAALGGRSTLLTALGESPVARCIADDIRKYGVTVVDAAPGLETASVSSAMVMVQGGDRAVVGGDAAGSIAPAPSPETVAALVDDVDVVLLDGHHPAFAIAAAKGCRDAQSPCVIDAGRWKPIMAAILPAATDIVASADFRTPDAPDAEVTADVLARGGDRVVVTTAGADPVRWWRGSESGQVFVPHVEVVDTLAAGDVFHGAYAYALAMALNVVERIDFANRVASLRCSMVGPRSWIEAIASVPLQREDQ